MSQPARNYSKGCPNLHPLREKSYTYALRKLYGVPDKYMQLYAGKYTPQRACEDLEAHKAGRPLPYTSKITKYHKILKKSTWHRGLFGTVGAPDARDYIYKKVYGMSKREIANVKKAMKASGKEHFTLDMAAKELRFQNKKRRNPTDAKYSSRDYKYAPTRRVNFQNLKYASIDPKDKYKQGRQGFTYGASYRGDSYTPSQLAARSPGSVGPRYSPRAGKWSSSSPIGMQFTPEIARRAEEQKRRQEQAAKAYKGSQPQNPPGSGKKKREERKAKYLAKKAAEAAAGQALVKKAAEAAAGQAGLGTRMAQAARQYVPEVPRGFLEWN